MSQTTTARFYSVDPALVIGSVLSKCLSASGATQILAGSRASSEKSQWEAFKAEIEFDPKGEWFGGPMTIQEASALVLDGFELTLDLGSPPMVREVHGAVLTEIPPVVYGQHCPGNMGCTVGWHDIYDSIENEEGHFFGRASFSVSFWGNFIPQDLAKYRSLFFELPAVVAAQRRLEAVLGPLGKCILLNV